MKTISANEQTVVRKWYIIDASDKTLGRLASRVAHILRGKHKPSYTPHVDCGDHIVIVNAEAIHLTGKKADNKIYYHHTGYPGGIRDKKFKEMSPVKVIEKAVYGMLPKNVLGRAMAKKLKVYIGADHPHIAQQPELLEEI